MAKAKLKWKVPPSKMIKALNEHPGRVLAALHAVGQRAATEMQNEARNDASWQDRTGNARSGLTGVAQKEKKRVKIILAHTVEYGPPLEFSFAGRYAIIEPTVYGYIPRLKKSLQDTFGK